MSNALARRDEVIASLKNRMRALRERGKTEGANILRTAEGMAAGYAIGFAEAKWGPDAAWGMAPSLAVGVAATGLALFDVGGSEMSSHLRAVGDAALAVFSYQKGYEHQRARAAAGA